ncbi:MAG: sodium:solute symporter family protein [Eubacteriales bacterium]|nr:sodium:solute symporter family protein [Eubacteriales bacterium]
MLRVISFGALILYFTVLIIAVLREKKNNTVEDFFFAGRTLPFWALSITFIASWWGAGAALSTADLAYTDGLDAFWYYGMPVLLATFLMFLLAKAIRKLPFLTQGKMMEGRYSKAVGKLVSIFIFLFMTFSAAAQMVGVGKFFGQYLGLSYEVAILLGTGIVIVYSLMGGFRGVVFTDVIQFVLLLCSAVIVLIVAWRTSGGWDAIAQAATAAGKTGYMDFSGGWRRYISYVLTFALAWTIQANVWQRISATRTVRDARRMTGTSFLIFIPLYFIAVLAGMAALAIYPSMPEGGVVSAIVRDYLPPVPGALVFIGISAAIMSTMDSLINTGAMTLTMDVWQGKGAVAIKRSRIATGIVSVIALIIALRIRSILAVAWIASDVITTGVFVPLIAGFLWRRGNSRGALSSMVAGLAYTLVHLAVSFGLPMPLPWPLRSTAQTLVGIGLSLVVYVVVSLLTPPEYERADAFLAAAGRSRRKEADRSI